MKDFSFSCTMTVLQEPSRVTTEGQEAIQKGKRSPSPEGGYSWILVAPQSFASFTLGAELEQVELVAPVGVVDHREDLQEDHRGVEEVTLEMTFPGDRSLAIGTRFQQPDLTRWAHCT